MSEQDHSLPPTDADEIARIAGIQDNEARMLAMMHRAEQKLPRGGKELGDAVFESIRRVTGPLHIDPEKAINALSKLATRRKK